MFFSSVHADDDLKRYPAAIQKAIEYAKNTDFSALEDGRQEIDGDKMYANLFHLTSKQKEEAHPELHKKYVDVQYWICGEELCGVAPYNGVGKCIETREDDDLYGIKLLGYWYNGWRNVSNSKRPIEKVEDLKGLTIRIAESQVFADMMEALGMQPVPLANSEIFTALQMGTVDGQENPQNNYINNKYFEVNRYFSMTRHVFSVEPVGMNLDLWNMLTEDEQATLMKAFDDATVYQRQLAQETEENQLKQVLADGADIVVTYIDDLTPFQEAVAGVYDKYKQTALKPYIEALEAAKAKVGE